MSLEIREDAEAWITQKVKEKYGTDPARYVIKTHECCYKSEPLTGFKSA
jgi:hypothetical protein